MSTEVLYREVSLTTVILGSEATPESKKDSGQARMTESWLDEPGDRVFIPDPFIRAFESPVAPQDARFEGDLNKIALLQRRFNSELGIMGEVGIRNYNPVLAWWRYEQLDSIEQKELFKTHEAQQVRTALRERFHSAQSIIKYTIDDSFKLRNELFATEPFAVGIARGIVYLKEQGSVDGERETKELEGFLKIEEHLANPNTPVESKMVIISPPSLKAGTIYKENFVDIYTLKEDYLTKKRVVEMTRFASETSYGEHTDAYFLSHPILVRPDEVFQPISQRPDVVLEEEFQEILKNSDFRIRFYIDTLCGADFLPEKIAVAFNAVLKGADLIRDRLRNLNQRVMDVVPRFLDSVPTFRNMEEEVNWLGRQQIERVVAPCGLSGGFSFRKGIQSLGSFSSSIISGVLNSESSGLNSEAPGKSKTCLSCGEKNHCTKECYKCGEILA